MAREEYSVEIRAQIVSLVMIAKMKPQDVATLLNIPRVSVYQIIQRAKEHGYDPTVNPRIEHEHVANKECSGRPKVVTEAIEASIIASVTKDRAGREKSAEYLAYEADFKNIIWTDEISVVLGHRRGSNCVWRRSFECYDPTVIRRRYKGACEFMFWVAFPMMPRVPVTFIKRRMQQQQKKAEKELEVINREREKVAREEWELNGAFSRLQLRPRPGRKPTFRFTAKNGKLVRNSKGGIDWYRYQKEVLVPKLLPFAQECKRSRLDTIRLLWLGNSPDLNAIEPTWFWLKKRTTLRGAPGDRKTAVGVWEKAWERLPQHRIQAWIERIPFHIQEIIRLEGKNEYPEGRPQGDVRSRCRRKGMLSFRAYLEDEWEGLEQS
ncbi:hypothetical protein TSTA_051610 [Talaromyces stipitatus ATCC 10500]|uniref:Uncharacterized protein n=1 Tax=Talaromyces stipitatus (strain ATCC 10500 / CBS 375.48 / QM 6759 / NRRL 1006) TaxID=441959 RepID=B8MJM5_TALSN|nr:uncharacterized protein TSTA_051610 [Talaromyces stipitatus ATCC 10500]EED15724.1 hypothetical protein TSTA_051610 [Talaromyces stipitatus ATCC 10500]